MRTSTIDERFSNFLECPSAERLLAVRELILAHPAYAPYAPQWQRLVQLHAAGDFAHVLNLVERLGEVGCLCPRLHFLAGTSAWELGDPARASAERECLHACLRGLLETGDGSPEEPFLVTYCWDAADILRTLRVSPERQVLVDHDHGPCDVVIDADGQEYWFQVGELLAHADRPCGHELRQAFSLELLRQD